VCKALGWVGVGVKSIRACSRWEVKEHKEHCKAAKNLDSKYNHTPVDENDPVKSAQLSFGPVAGKYEGSLLAASESCLLDPMAFVRFIPFSRALSYVDRYDDKAPKEAS